MHLLALVLIFAFAATTAVAATVGAEGRTRRALVPARIKRRRPDLR